MVKKAKKTGVAFVWMVSEGKHWALGPKGWEEMGVMTGDAGYMGLNLG